MAKVRKNGQASLASTRNEGEGWVVPKLQRGFTVDKAWQKAVQKAAAHMEKILSFDDLTLELQDKEAAIVGVVKDKDSGKIMQEYEAAQVVRLYAHNMQMVGVVVDGRV